MVDTPRARTRWALVLAAGLSAAPAEAGGHGLELWRYPLAWAPLAAVIATLVVAYVRNRRRRGD